jgi:hypothetical protein
MSNVLACLVKSTDAVLILPAVKLVVIAMPLIAISVHHRFHSSLETRRPSAIGLISRNFKRDAVQNTQSLKLTSSKANR